MKMNTGLFWGSFLIILGIAFIVKIFFNISIFRILIAFILIYFGIKLLLGKDLFHCSQDGTRVFGSTRIYNSVPINNTEYNTVFSKTTYDFRDVDTLKNLPLKISFNTVFGDTEILLPKGVNISIKADAVFASVKMPNGNTVAFGSASYRSPGFGNIQTQLEIQANVVFGNLQFSQ